MFKLFCSLCLAVLVASSCSAQQPGANAHVTATPTTPAVRAAITQAVHKMAPQAKVQSILPSPIPGLYQVVAQGQVLYLTGDGRYVFQGNAFDIKTRTPLNSVAMNRLRSEAIAKLSPGQMIRFAPAHPKYTVTVFTDVDCPYCRAFHANIAAINKLGIAVDYLFWPRTGLGTASAQKAVAVWCAPNRQAALTAAFEGTAPSPAQCSSPVARDFHLGVDLGVGGTPTVIADNGQILGGYVAPEELLRRLQTVHAAAQGRQAPPHR